MHLEEIMIKIKENQIANPPIKTMILLYFAT